MEGRNVYQTSQKQNYPEHPFVNPGDPFLHPDFYPVNYPVLYPSYRTIILAKKHSWECMCFMLAGHVDSAKCSMWWDPTIIYDLI